MMRYKVIGFSILFLSFVAFGAEKKTTKAAKSWDDYKIITERNIFSRYRTRVIPMSEMKQQVVVVPEETYYTLRGITKQSDEYVSFLEDSRTMAVSRFRNGDSIAGGKINDITLDYLSYKNGGKTRKVEIGMNLEGQVSSSGTQFFNAGFNNSGNSGLPAMAQGQAQNMGQFPGMGQTQGMGQVPGMDQAQGGRGQFPGMDQTQSIGQQQGIPQRQTMGQTQSTGQSAATGQTQAIGQARTAAQSSGQAQTITQSPTAGQPNTAVQAVTGSEQRNTDSATVLQRLKERRKKELE
jgi:hypothetical protein